MKMMLADTPEENSSHFEVTRSNDSKISRNDKSRFYEPITALNLDKMNEYAGQNYIGKIWKLNHNNNEMPSLNQI